jgi:fused signal recognition particle receptor
MDGTWILILILIVVVGVGGFVLIRARPPRDTPTQRPSDAMHGLARSAAALGAALRGAWASGVDDSTYDILEEALLGADVGVQATDSVISGVRSMHPSTPEEARDALAIGLRSELGDFERGLSLTGSPAVILVVGVNGTGKTTTIAKIAARLQAEQRSVVIGAADTFRAAASAQLDTWGERLGVPVVTAQEGADPASVVFDTVASARARGTDVVIIDTAGRLHAKKNLMAELGKIHRVAAGEGTVDEVLLVLDATGGQNGLTQVREFATAVPVTGIVLTKLDGSARGGIVIAVERELGVPVKFVGLGEGAEDLEPFDPDRFVTDLLELS